MSLVPKFILDWQPQAKKVEAFANKIPGAISSAAQRWSDLVFTIAQKDHWIHNATYKISKKTGNPYRPKGWKANLKNPSVLSGRLIRSLQPQGGSRTFAAGGGILEQIRTVVIRGDSISIILGSEVPYAGYVEDRYEFLGQSIDEASPKLITMINNEIVKIYQVN